MSLFGKALAEHTTVVENDNRSYLVNKKEFDQFASALKAIVEMIVTEQVKQIGGGQWEEWNWPFTFKYKNPPDFISVNLVELILKTTWPEYKFTVTPAGPNGTSRVKENRLFLKSAEYAVYKITTVVPMSQLIEERNDYVSSQQNKKEQERSDTFERLDER